MLQASTWAATLSQGFTAPFSDVPAIEIVMIAVTACVYLWRKFVNFPMCEVKPLFQLRSEEGLGTELTTALKCHPFH